MAAERGENEQARNVAEPLRTANMSCTKAMGIYVWGTCEGHEARTIVAAAE